MTTNHDVRGTSARADAPSRTEHLRGLPVRHSPLVDAEELAAADSFELPGADPSTEEIAVEIRPAQVDEFTCASCFLVRHRSQIALDRGGVLYCSDCEG